MHPSRVGVHKLTPAENDVLRLLAAGLDYWDIAAIRCCKVKTVNKHAQMIYAKLGVHSQTAAALLAWRRNIISIEDAWQMLQIHKMGEKWQSSSQQS